MNEKRKRHDADFKKEIAQIYLEGRRIAPSLADELGVHVNTIYKWGEQYRGDPEQAFPGSGHMKPNEEELARTKRRVRELEEKVEILKKRRSSRVADCILRKEQQIRYRFVYDHRFKYTAVELCRIMKVSRSGYYKWVKSGCPMPCARDAVTLAVIRKIELNDGSYGVRRVHRSLNDEHGIRCGYGKTAQLCVKMV